MNDSNQRQSLARGKHLELVVRDGWEYATRTQATGVVMIAALTEHGEAILVEQQRVPVGARVLEWPAGLAGDEAQHQGETLRAAAERELMEETGFEAGRWKQIATVATSAGMTDEVVTMFVALDCRRKGQGGGEGNEKIQVHLVPWADIEEFLAQQVEQGNLLDARLYTGLYWLQFAQ